MNKRKIAILLNIIIIIFEIIALIISHKTGGLYNIIYYTQESNILALISSIIILIYLIKNKKFSRILSIFRFISIVSMSVTFLVVIFVLAPMYEFNYYWLLFVGASLYMHLLCPLIGFISFVFFEKHKLNNKKDVLRGIYFTFIYAVIAIVLNVLKVIEGPYPFLYVYKNSLIMSIFYFVLILGSSYLISLGLLKIKNKYGN